MKKKIISLVFGIFMSIFSLVSFAGCSLISSNTDAENKKTVLKVGDKELSKSDIITSFYTYYQNNSSYFSYYDEETIEESFYTWAIIKEVINQKSAEAMYDADTNPTGFIVYTQENEDDIWEKVYDYVYEQVSSYEKNIYKSAGYEEANYPVWLKTDEEDASATKFEAYEKIEREGVCLDKSKAVKKSTEEQIRARIVATATNLKAYLFEHIVETDEDGNDTRKPIKDTVQEEQKYLDEIKKDKFISNARSQAYVDYIAGLVNSAKNTENFVSEEELINQEIIRVYKAYYESEITTLLQTYYLDNYLMNGEDTPLTDKAIAEAFLSNYSADYQTYQFEDSYITVMTSTEGASLVLYHYDGQDYFFTVQHILVKNDTYITDEIKKLPGYDSSGKYDYDSTDENSVANQFMKKRQELTNAYFMASAVNKDNIKDSIVVDDFAHYYHYDKERANAGDNWGYITVVVEEVDEDGETVKHYYEDADGDGVADLIDADEDGQIDDKIEIEEKNVLYLATDEEIENCYDFNLEKWVKLAEQYEAADEAGKATLRENNEDLAYVFDTVDNILSTSKTAEEKKIAIRQKIASYLFIELEWIFSSDSLGNEYSNKRGYVMSNYPDEHGSWVSEFAYGARDLIKQLKGKKNDGTYTYETVQEGLNALLAGDIAAFDAKSLTKKVISTYGYHIIKVEDVFEGGYSLVNVEAIKTALGATKIDLDQESHLNAVIKAIKETYICSGSNETLYDHYFDELYTKLVGSSWLGDTSQEATSGTYFLKLEYEWLHDLYQADEVEYVDKVGYKELLESIQ